MSINTTPPVSLKEIQDNFYKSGAVGSVDRYVIDFAQRDGVTWDLPAQPNFPKEIDWPQKPTGC